MKVVLCLLCQFAAFASGAGQVKVQPSDIAQAKKAFADAQAVSEKEGGHLWGRKLYGKMLFVDPQTRFTVSNEPDARGVLHPSDGVYVGTLPENVIVSNAPTEWEENRGQAAFPTGCVGRLAEK